MFPPPPKRPSEDHFGPTNSRWGWTGGTRPPPCQLTGPSKGGAPPPGRRLFILLMAGSRQPASRLLRTTPVRRSSPVCCSPASFVMGDPRPLPRRGRSGDDGGRFGSAEGGGSSPPLSRVQPRGYSHRMWERGSMGRVTPRGGDSRQGATGGFRGCTGIIPLLVPCYQTPPLQTNIHPK